MHVKEKVKSENMLGEYAPYGRRFRECGMRTFSTQVCKALIRTEREIKKSPTVLEKNTRPGGYAPMVADSANAECEPSAHGVCKALIRTEREIKKSPPVVGDFFMARPGGFEPSTYRFVAGHSIH